MNVHDRNRMDAGGHGIFQRIMNTVKLFERYNVGLQHFKRYYWVKRSVDKAYLPFFYLSIILNIYSLFHTLDLLRRREKTKAITRRLKSTAIFL